MDDYDGGECYDYECYADECYADEHEDSMDDGPACDEPEDSMDGDAESALASVGWGTDEDYGDFGGGEDF